MTQRQLYPACCRADSCDKLTIDDCRHCQHLPQLIDWHETEADWRDENGISSHEIQKRLKELTR